MKPYYSENGIEIYHGDCQEVLHSFNYTWDKWDLLLTDPPYGIDYGKQGSFSASHGWATLREDLKWDEKRPIRAVFNYLVSLSRNQIIWGGNYFTDYLWPSMGWLIWDKGQREFSLADCEMAWTSFQKATRIFNYARGKSLKDGRNHPTQKPLALMQWCIQQAPADTKTILDPFMGSGTTLLAAKNLGRHCVGIEKEEKYCEIAVKRLQQEVLPFKEATKCEQLTL